MSDDLRTSLKLWLDVTVFVGLMAVCGAVLREVLSSDQLSEAFDRTPAWVWVLAVVWGLLNLGRFGWGLWQRRAPKSSDLNVR
jgi:hypothetical protein